jgi:hypothetical protein
MPSTMKQKLLGNQLHQKTVNSKTDGRQKFTIHRFAIKLQKQREGKCNKTSKIDGRQNSPFIHYLQ